MTSYFVDIKSGSFGSAQPAVATLAFPSDGQGGLTTIVGGAGLAFTAAVNGGSAVATSPLVAGTAYYAFTSTGFWARAIATSTSAFTVDVWKHQSYDRIGRIPSGTITFHTPSICSEFLLSEIASVQIMGSTATGNISFTDPIGTVLRGIKVPATPLPNDIDFGDYDLEIRGPFGIIVSVTTNTDAVVMFNLKKPVFGNAILNRVI